MGKRQTKYLAVYQLAVIHALKNYKSLIGLSIFLITCLIIFSHIWKIAAVKVGVFHLHPDLLLWYIALNEWVLISLPEIQLSMQQDLRSGRLAYLLPRPISYLGATFAEATGTLTVNLLVLGVTAFVFTWIRVGSLPFHPLGFALVIATGILAGIVAILFMMLIGLSAFWLHEVTPMTWIWEKMLFLFGGLILPLSVYPEWMQKIAHFTPYPVILGGRSAIVFDLSMDHFFYIFTSLATWASIGIIGITLVYRRGLRILNIEGG